MPPNANVNDRPSIEALYPAEVFEADAGANSMGHAHFLRGIRVEAGSDESGAVRIARATQSLSDADHPACSAFLCPYMGRAYGLFMLQGGGRGAVDERRDIFEPHLDEYSAFIDKIIETGRHSALAPGGSRDRMAGWG
jgi:hypothetical protein